PSTTITSVPLATSSGQPYTQLIDKPVLPFSNHCHPTRLGGSTREFPKIRPKSVVCHRWPPLIASHCLEV
ncbi:hypothetical protein PanWU01x14_157670, partial [Parasponia andersonii]